jgi:DNA-binding MarR family transcriptional regulator
MPAHFQHKGGERHLLREIVRAHQVLMSAFSRNMGMPASRFALMRQLATAENGMGVTDLAAALEIDAAAVTRLVKEMEAERLATRRPDPHDRRRNYVSLSGKGAKLFEQLHHRSHELERALDQAIGAEELTAAAEVLAKLRDFVGRLPHEPG